MTTFEKWQQRYMMNGATADQLQRLVDLGILTEQEFTTITGQAPDDMALQRWRAMASCSRLQARIALKQAGLFDTIQAFIDLPETSLVAKEAWAEAYRFSRNSQLFDVLGPALGMTPEQIDDLFLAAQAVVV